ncbi:ATPase domain-containing protein [Candidatus Magnetomoraceae bacterium gMMP-15]
MQYPLHESIGIPELFVGRKLEFELFDNWLKRIPKQIAKSRAILARRKSGKTAFIQRIFNNLWNENGKVIPFYFSIPDKKMWYPDFAMRYYRTFASHYISFLERDTKLIQRSLTLQQIKDYGRAKSINAFVNDVDSILTDKERASYDLVWDTACAAPHVFAAIYDTRFLVIIDEFQNISQYIYRDKNCKKVLDDSLAGSFHELVESKIAPMLVTGSYVGWLISVIDASLEAGRLKRIFMNPYLTEEEGLEAVKKYAEVYGKEITQDTAEQINKLCMSDPFFISCVIRSTFHEKSLKDREGVIETVNYEIANKNSEMSVNWRDYIDTTLSRINNINAKKILLHLSKYYDREWKPAQLKKALHLQITEPEIFAELKKLAKADLILEGISDIRFSGLTDGTLNLILRNRFEEEISGHFPDIKEDFNHKLDELEKENLSLKGSLSSLKGEFAEYRLAKIIRSKKRFSLSVFFDKVKDNRKLNLKDVRTRVMIQRDDGKNMEIDVVAKSECGRILLIEVKYSTKIGIKIIRDFLEKVEIYKDQHAGAVILPAFLSTGGFTEPAKKLCMENRIAISEKMP